MQKVEFMNAIHEFFQTYKNNQLTSMVAIFGSIIPAPFTIPTSRAPVDKVLLRTFGKRSVVQMALAALSAETVCKFWTATGTTSSANSFAGSRHPITPVDDGNTLLAPPARDKASATAWQTRSASATPSPPEQTLETLLLMTRAWRGPPSANRWRPTMTGAPGN
jgi:hypothetical protein